MAKEPGQGTEHTSKWLDWLDVAAKLIGALAVAYITWIAKDYESKMSATTLLIQREQAESSLRASMLHDLVGPIVGQGPAKEFDPDRERLLVELLTLNFHDHFEFKPLLAEVDKKLARSGNEQGRRSLESVARRVIDRQVNMLGATARTLEDKAEPAVDWYFEETQGAVPTTTTPAECQSRGASTPAKFKGPYGEVVCANSPDNVYRVDVSIRGVDFDKKTVKAYVNIVRNKPATTPTPWARQFEFDLTPFDFPLTDNTEVDPEHRFALMLYNIEKGGKAHIEEEDVKGVVVLKLVWFPKGYITERERPVNYLEMRKVLGVEKKADKG